MQKQKLEAEIARLEFLESEFARLHNITAFQGVHEKCISDRMKDGLPLEDLTFLKLLCSGIKGIEHNSFDEHYCHQKRGVDLEFQITDENGKVLTVGIECKNHKEYEFYTAQYLRNDVRRRFSLKHYDIKILLCSHYHPDFAVLEKEGYKILELGFKIENSIGFYYAWDKLSSLLFYLRSLSNNEEVVDLSSILLFDSKLLDRYVVDNSSFIGRLTVNYPIDKIKKGENASPNLLNDASNYLATWILGLVSPKLEI